LQFKKKIILLFIIFFGTLSFPMGPERRSGSDSSSWKGVPLKFELFEEVFQ